MAASFSPDIECGENNTFKKSFKLLLKLLTAVLAGGSLVVNVFIVIKINTLSN